MKKLLTTKVSLPLIVIILILGIIPAEYFFLKKFPPSSPKPSNNEKYLPKIKKLISLPDETPQFATVSDIDKINSQPFFTNAKNGDIVLIYQASRKTILYRPSENKIIEVGTVNPIPTPTSIPSASPTPTPNVLK
jgi:hypothetical protein